MIALAFLWLNYYSIAVGPSIGNKRPRNRFVDDDAHADGEDNDDDELSPFEGQEEEVSDLIDDSDDDGDDADQQAFHIERMVAQ